jgi:hypothetical protein
MRILERRSVRSSMSVEAKAEVLRDAGCGSGLDDVGLVRLATASEEQASAPGSVLVRANQRGGSCLVILSGTASMSVEGAEVAVLIGPGTVLEQHGDPAAGVTVTAVTLMHLLSVPASEHATGFA